MNRALLFLVFLSHIISFFANEYIPCFESTITVHQDASLTVKEVISVISTGKQVKHGIVRIFPTRYGNKKIPFNVRKIMRNDEPSKYDIDHVGNFAYVYIREKNKLLAPGLYTFEISYNTDRQLGFFKNYDELAWNVTGAFTLPINKVIANIILPPNIPRDKIQLVAYTGYQGERGEDYTAQILENGVCQFETTRPFNQHENITVVAVWPKGYIKPPTTLQNIKYALLDHLTLFLAILGLLILLIFFITVKLALRNKIDHVIIPRFNAPPGMFPGKIKFLLSNRYNKTAFAADIVNMGVLELLQIEPIKKFWSTKYQLIKDTPKRVPEEYTKAYATFFRSKHKLMLDDSNITTIKSAWEKMEDEAKDDSEKYINLQKIWVFRGFILGFILYIGALILTFYIDGSAKGGSFLMPVLLFPVFPFSLFFKTYTIEGAKIIDEIKGFKMFLSATEADRLAMTSAPERTPQQYERFLPYAIALGVEKNWTEQFAPIFEKLIKEGKTPQAHWYIGHNFHSAILSQSLGNAISSSLVKSTHAPGTKSSFGGGGSSGSGGGGGGGGGC